MAGSCLKSAVKNAWRESCVQQEIYDRAAQCNEKLHTFKILYCSLLKCKISTCKQITKSSNNHCLTIFFNNITLKRTQPVWKIVDLLLKIFLVSGKHNLSQVVVLTFSFENMLIVRVRTRRNNEWRKLNRSLLTVWTYFQNVLHKCQ